MAPLKEAALNKTRTSAKFPLDVVYGTLEDGGLGMTNLYTKLGITKIKKFVEHLDKDTITGKMIRTSLEALKLEIGVGRDIFTLDYDRYGPIATDCWVKSIWEYAHKNDMDIRERYTPNIELQRENDLYIMELIANDERIKTNELIKINRCRLHLQVNTLSDIYNGYGDDLTRTYTCHKDTT